MGHSDHLVEQHILESTARLRHIDEAMNQARQTAASDAAAGETDALLARIQADRDLLARTIDELRRLPRGDDAGLAERAAGLKGVLESVGLQLEQALTAVLEPGKR
jgi:hypothetical protein